MLDATKTVAIHNKSRVGAEDGLHISNSHIHPANMDSSVTGTCAHAKETAPATTSRRSRGNPTISNLLSLFGIHLLDELSIAMRPRSHTNTIIPSAEVLQKYRDALAHHKTGTKTIPHVPKQARVAFFHLNDGDKKKVKAVKNTAVQDGGEVKNTSKRSKNPDTRRNRVVAYVWVDMTEADGQQKGAVFFGGSVYNPRMTLKNLVRHRALRGTSTLDEISAVLGEIKKEVTHVPNYNRRGESKTALGRLERCPVIFETNATSHEQVRREVERQMFRRGVSAERA